MIRKIKFSPQDEEGLKSISIDKSKLKDDYFDYSKVVINKPWGYEYLTFKNENVAVWVLYIRKDFQTSLHCHPNKKTSLILLKGKVISSTLNGSMELAIGEGLLIEKGVFHSTKAISKEGAIVIETETPTNKRDLIRLGDKYGRQSNGYEGKNYHIPIDSKEYSHLQFFHSYDNRYLPNQKIGHCYINIIKCENIKKLLDLNDNRIVCILNGKIINQKNDTILEHGDVTMSNDLKKNINNSAIESIEILTIHKD